MGSRPTSRSAERKRSLIYVDITRKAIGGPDGAPYIVISTEKDVT